MKIPRKIFTKNHIPEYETLLEAIEDQEDIAAIKEFHKNKQPTIPFDLLQEIANGKINFPSLKIYPRRAKHEYRNSTKNRARDRN